MIKWEQLVTSHNQLAAGEMYCDAYRAKIPGGWLVKISGPDDGALTSTFIPDPGHQWDGNSLP